MYTGILKKLIPLFAMSIYLQAQVSVSASVDANNISKSETFGFKIIATNADESPSVDISPLSTNFRVISGPAQQTNIQWINGAMTSTRSLTWTLLAMKNGKLNIPSMNVRVGNKNYKTNPIGIVVEKGLGKAQVANLFIEAKPDKEQIHLGEQVTITYRLFTRTNLSVESIEYPKSIGFWSEDLLPARTARFNNTQINGINYKVATLYKSAMFPTQIGKLRISPMTAICNVEVSQRKRRGVFDDPFFNSMFKETQRKFIESDTLTINVVPYPESPPVDFTGAVGSFTINTWIDTPQVSVNEAVSLHVLLQGTGNLNQFKINQIDFPQNMEVFPPTSSFKRDEFRDQITGEQKFEYILIPRQAGSYNIKSIPLTYFDPALDQFLTIKSQPLVLTVSPGDGIAITNKKIKEDVDLIANDIRYIKTDPHIKLNPTNGVFPLWVLSSYIISMGLFMFPTVFMRINRYRDNSFDFRANRAALRAALKDINKDSSDPFAHTSFVMYKYFKTKLYLRSDNLDPLILENILKSKLPPELLDKTISLAKICDASRFSPNSTKKINDIISEFKKLLTDIDKIL